MRGQQEAGRSQSQLWPGASYPWERPVPPADVHGLGRTGPECPPLPWCLRADTGPWCRMEAGFT